MFATMWAPGRMQIQTARRTCTDMNSMHDEFWDSAPPHNTWMQVVEVYAQGPWLFIQVVYETTNGSWWATYRLENVTRARRRMNGIGSNAPAM